MEQCEKNKDKITEQRLDNEWRIYLKKQRENLYTMKKQIFFLLTIMFVLSNGILAAAWCDISPAERIYKACNRRIISTQDCEFWIDLIGDGKEEHIENVYDKINSFQKVLINEEEVMKFTGNESQVFYLMDINKKDSYIEIIFEGSKKYNVYHYTGTRLKKIATWNKGFSLNKNYMPTLMYTKGNKTLTAYAGTWGKNVPSLYLIYTYKYSNGSITFDKTKSHKVVTSNTAYSNVSKWTVYKYPRASNNKKAFVLKKKSKYSPIEVKLDTKYFYMKIKDTKSRKTGWVVFKRNALRQMSPLYAYGRSALSWADDNFTKGWAYAFPGGRSNNNCKAIGF